LDQAAGEAAVMAASFALVPAAKCAHLNLSAWKNFMKENVALRN